MVTAVGYAYPWDFDDPAAASRAVDLGVDAVAVAAAYHSTRAATPLHPSRRTVVAAHAAFYLPVRGAAWRGARLVPAAPSWPGSFTEASAAIRSVGLPVHAWVVLTHSTRLGTAHPDLTVRNAFGESYEYALCPSHAEVADYCATLVAETVELGAPDGLVLEACGPLGVDHGGHHDKLEFAAWGAVERKLLSLCFCTACTARYRAAGVPADRLAARVREALTWSAEWRTTRRPDRRVDHPSADRVEDVTPDAALGEYAEAVRAVRTGLAAGLRERVLAEVPHGVRVALHASPDPYATGPFATVAPPATAARSVPGARGSQDPERGTRAYTPRTDSSTSVPNARADALVATCWRPETGEATLAALREVGGAARIGGYVRPDTLPADHGGLAELVRRYLGAGLDELHLYHLGLLPEPALRQLADLVATARRHASAPAPAPTSSTAP